MPERSRISWIPWVLVGCLGGALVLTVVAPRSPRVEPLATPRKAPLGYQPPANPYPDQTKPLTEVTEKPLEYQAFTNRFPDQIPGLPLTAEAIHLAASSVGLGGRAHLYRFDAPIPDCVAYGKALLATNGMSKARRDSLSFPLRADLTNSPAPVDVRFLSNYGLENIDWFDVETITNGFQGFGPPMGFGMVWVDAGRGRVYYYWTD
jgi:hypothetical protein